MDVHYLYISTFDQIAKNNRADRGNDLEIRDN